MHAPRQHPRKRLLRLQLNGRWREDAISEGALLVDYLREPAATAGSAERAPF
jgi:4-hydroxybenzoyl-CoA reductase subunit gamma